ncbi:MAG: TolC family protein [Candidatus Sumerlaeia bacterium]|nr:TolC family protein [Candidatus Sumerlaeia bacterium]
MPPPPPVAVPIVPPAASANPTTASLAVSAHPAAELASDTSLQEITFTSQTLGEWLYWIVSATEENDPQLKYYDTELRRIDAEMKEIWASVGWEFEVTRQRSTFDAERHETRAGTTLGLDGRPRRAYDLFGDYDRRDRDLILRLKRSFLGPDHEVYVRICGRRLEKMDAVIQKQQTRRDIHLLILQAVLDILYRRNILPLVAEQIALVQRKTALLEVLQKAGEVLRKDLLAAQKQLRAYEEQQAIHQNAITLALNDLRGRTGLTTLTLPTQFQLAVAPSTLPATLAVPDATSQALQNRLEYLVAQMRVELAEQMTRYMSWYFPRVDFEVAWNKYRETREFLDETRDERGRELTTELTVNIPLGLPYRTWKRRESFRATQEGYALQVARMRRSIENEILRASLDLQQARLHCEVAREALEHALEELRATELVARQLPGEIQGIAALSTLDAQLKVLDARMALTAAEHQLLLAHMQWDYHIGCSPMDEASAGFADADLRAAEKIGWLRWWTSLIK